VGTGGDEAIAYSPSMPVIQQAPQPVVAVQPTVPAATVSQVKRLPASNESRPVGYVAPPTYGTMTTDDSSKGFSTSGGSSTPLAPRPTTTSSASPRPEGLLGLVILNDANRK
jgi:hypothetical protein